MSKSLIPKEIATQAKQTIFSGSKSFSLASLFFSNDEQESVHMLYAWCRYTDDQIDQCESILTDQKFQVLQKLREDTKAAFADTHCSHPVFAGLQYVVQKYKIPQTYADETLQK